MTPASTGPPARLPAASHYVPGEVMEFAMSVHGMQVARATLVAGAPGTVEGQPALVVRSELETVGLARMIRQVRDDLTTWIDMSSGRLLELKADTHIGEHHTQLKGRFSGDRLDIEYARDGSTPRKKRFSLPAGEVAHDTHTLLGAVRAWKPRPGDQVYFYGLSGRRVWLGQARVVGQETVRTPLGLFPALRVEGSVKRLTDKLEVEEGREPRTFTAWLSDDAHRVPLRLQGKTDLGDVTVELTRYQPPAQAARASAP